MREADWLEASEYSELAAEWEHEMERVRESFVPMPG